MLFSVWLKLNYDQKQISLKKYSIFNFVSLSLQRMGSLI